MRSNETPRELTYESFVETFGKEPIKCAETVTACKILPKRRSMFARPREVAASLLKAQGTKCTSIEQEEMNNKSPETSQAGAQNHKETRTERMSRKLRKISLRKKDPSKSPGDVKKASTTLHRSKSVSFLGKTHSSGNWLTTFNASVHQRVARKNTSAVESSEPPMSKMTSATHKGFLSKKNQKRQTWTRYWCILQDSCLYCYSTQNAEFADDVIAFGGYTLTESKPHLCLERHGKETYEFKADDEKSQTSWENALLRVLQSGKKKLRRSASTNQPLRKKLAPVYERSVSDLCIDVAKVKAKLLQEVLAQQEEIIREQKMLEKLASAKQQPAPVMTSSPVIKSKPAKADSMSSLAQLEDHGYCSSVDGSMHDTFSEIDDSRQNSPSARSYRSMSTVSVASSASLCSIPEERRKSSDVCPKVLAEIEEFRTFSQLTIKRRQPRD